VEGEALTCGAFRGPNRPQNGQSVRAQCAVGVGRLSAVTRAIILIVAVTLAAACAAAGRDDSNVDVGRTPYFRPAPGWEAVQLGTSATAANVALGPYSSEGGFPGDTLERLKEREVVVWAMFSPMRRFPAQDEETPRRDLPLSLDDAQHGGFFEGQPGHVWADRILAQANGWNIDVWTFYGSDDPTANPGEPTAEARAAAQEQLARLVVPARV
jgi:hypothetical protein